MRTVETFDLGTVMTTGAAEECVVVAHNGVFSHAHYFRRYGSPDQDHGRRRCSQLRTRWKMGRGGVGAGWLQCLSFILGKARTMKSLNLKGYTMHVGWCIARATTKALSSSAMKLTPEHLRIF